MLLHSFIAPTVVIEKSAVQPTTCHSSVRNLFSLNAFKLPLSLVIWNFTTVCFGVWLFREFGTSWIWMPMVLIKFGVFLVIIFEYCFFPSYHLYYVFLKLQLNVHCNFILLSCLLTSLTYFLLSSLGFLLCNFFKFIFWCTLCLAMFNMLFNLSNMFLILITMLGISGSHVWFLFKPFSHLYSLSPFVTLPNFFI